MDEKVDLRFPDGKQISLPVITGTEGEKAIDIRTLRNATSYVAYDPGYGNTGACQSQITFIDGEKGILRYRGIPIEILAERRSFLETSYLLINGSLPNDTELAKFRQGIKDNCMIHEHIRKFYEGFPLTAHPMPILASIVMSLSTFHTSEEGSPEEISYMNSLKLFAKMPTIAAFSYKKSIGEPFVYPDNSLGFLENFLHMMFSRPTEKYEVNPVFIEALNRLMILHADHELNCSTAVVRMVRSSMSNIYACINAAICALWGPRHGGANQRVLEMLEQIHENDMDVDKTIKRAKDREDPFRLFGFGHRVYKNFDPRARLVKDDCTRMLKTLEKADPLLDIAMELEERALNDSYFIERKLFPNVDFYSGIMYRAMGIPKDAFTVMFALGRIPGWLAHAKEFTASEEQRIRRPRQVYMGETCRTDVKPSFIKSWFKS